MRKFGQLKVHEGKHPATVHRFNPYDQREALPDLDDNYFKSMLNVGGEDCGLNLDHCFTGCLDAPDFIPLGASECITTLGGFDREEYMNASREQVDWKANRQVEAEVAVMLKEILMEAV